MQMKLSHITGVIHLSS